MVSATVLFSCLSVQIRAQNAKGSETVEGAIITKLSPPTYPRIALQARITGDVELRLEVRSDGTVESIVSNRGHPLLKPAAEESARQSQFACVSCGAEVRTYRLVYTFELRPTSYCTDKVENSNSNPEQPYPRVTQSQGHVTIIEQPVGICDPAGTITYSRVRSVKCLYLWKCAKPHIIILE